MKPIVIYPETVSGAPYGGALVTRYILNFPGLLGGDLSYDSEEMCFSYSKILAETTRDQENILYIPTSDIRIFYPPKTDAKREGTCYYAAKFKTIHKGNLFEITSDSLEITSGSPDSQTPEEIANIFRSSEIFFTYENTALATEAALCGCPVVFLPNPYLDAIIAAEELGTDGFAWGAAPDEIARAKETVKFAFHNYISRLNDFYKDIEKFINKTQEHAKRKEYSPEDLKLLLSHLPKSTDESWKNNNYAPLLKKLPHPIEKKIGELLCSLGLTSDGQFLWNRAIKRSKKEPL